jgi:hypothetical protein
MLTLLSGLKTVTLFVLRGGLFTLGIATLLLLFVAVWLERLLRGLAPLIFAGLPPGYRRLLVLMVTPPPHAKVAIEQQSP